MTCFSFIAPLVLAELSAGSEPACASPPMLLRPPLRASKCLVLQKRTCSRVQHGPWGRGEPRACMGWPDGFGG